MRTATFSMSVEASAEQVWAVLTDKLEHPARYGVGVDVEILERSAEGTLRKLTHQRTGKVASVERLRVDPEQLRIESQILEHPTFTGRMIKEVTRPHEGTAGPLPVLTYTLHWEPSDPQDTEDMTATLMKGVDHTAKAAEELALGGQLPGDGESAGDD